MRRARTSPSRDAFTRLDFTCVSVGMALLARSRPQRARRLRCARTGRYAPSLGNATGSLVVLFDISHHASVNLVVEDLSNSVGANRLRQLLWVVE